MLCLEPTEFAQEPLTFFHLPGEVRNAIYHDLISWHVDVRGERLLLDQPAITRVNRQTRGEALPLYYGERVGLLVKRSSSCEWVEAVQKITDAFTGGPKGLPGFSSTLRHVAGLELGFVTQDPALYIAGELTSGPETLMDEESDFETVTVGSPDMDWTDAAAVRAACFEAAIQLNHNLIDRLFDDPDRDNINIIAASDRDDQRAALDAMCVVASACPRLTRSVCICDYSGNIDENLGQLVPRNA